MTRHSINSICSYCGVGCGVSIDYDQNTGLIDLVGNKCYPVNRGMLCAKGMNLHHSVMNIEDRLSVPMMRANRQLKLQECSWDDVLTRTAKVFSSLIDKFGPDSVGFYVSGQLLTEEYYIVNKLIKGFIGSNNIDTNSRLCMSSAVVAQKKAFGEDSVPVCYDDIELADCLLVAGANPAWCHPIIFRRMEAAKLKNPQVKWIVIDPRKTQSTQMADLHLQIIPGTDIEVFHGIARCLIETENIDQKFIDQHVNGFNELKQKVMSRSLAEYAQVAGVSVSDLILAADWIAQAQGFLSMWTQGLNQSVVGVNKNLALINLSLITGKIGRPGNGPLSLTGQPNAMGGREVGGLATMLAVHKDIQNPQHRAEIAQFWGVPVSRISDKLGLTATEMFQALESGRMKAIWIICTNPIVSMPEARRIEQALQKANFVVVQDISKSSATLAFADVVLPAAGYMEKSGTMTNAERRIGLVEKVVEPPGYALPDAEIIWRFAEKMGWRRFFNYSCYEDIYNEYKQQTSATNLDVSGVTYDLLRQTSVQWPYPNSYSNLDLLPTPRLFSDGLFYTPDGRANVFAVETADESEPLSDEFPLILNTGRIRDQWHTMTRTGQVNKLMQHISEPYLEIHPIDALNRGILNQQLVSVRSLRGNVTVRAQITESIHQGSVFLPMHWGRKLQFHQRNVPNDVNHDLGRANNLTEMRVDPLSKQPNFKFSAVEIQPLTTYQGTVIVIGAGSGSAEFVKQFRSSNPNARIEVFSREKNPFYNRILLPDYLSGHKSWDDLVMLSESDCNNLNIKIHAGLGIRRIDSELKLVEDELGQLHQYDDLLVCTGSRSFVPSNIPSAVNIFGIRQKEDVDDIMDQLSNEKPQSAKILVLGGGLLGLEMADAFLQLGHQVDVVQISNQLMRRQLDEVSSDLLKKLLLRKGLNLHFNEEVVQYIQDKHNFGSSCIVHQVKLKSGKILDVDIIIVAVGTRPNIELLKEARIDCQYGVCVNEHMQTSAPHVYAIGEIAELNGKIWGISPAAQEQATVVARVLSGDLHAYYSGSTLMNILKLYDVQLASIGMTDVPSENANQYQVVRLEDIDRNYYKKCIVYRNRLVGAILLGDKNEFNEFRRLIDQGVELNELRDTLLRPGGVIKPPIQGQLVCSCNNVGDENIRVCIREGAQSLEDIVERTGAGAGCGSCKPEISKLLFEMTLNEAIQGSVQ